MQLVIELPERAEQLSFNRRRWEEVAQDRFLADLPYRVETNGEGNLLMSPRPNFHHAERCQRINETLNALMKGGKAYTEVPINTIDGVRAADVAWISDERRRESLAGSMLERAPEIGVEVVSASNSETELRHKRNLYFEAGAIEVWQCGLDNEIQFFTRDAPAKALRASRQCPAFPGGLAN